MNDTSNNAIRTSNANGYGTVFACAGCGKYSTSLVGKQIGGVWYCSLCPPQSVAALLDRAVDVMSALHRAIEPDLDHPEIPGIVPAAAMRTFVDALADIDRARCKLRPSSETLHVGASDWEEFGIAVRTVSQNCDMTDIARRGDWLQRELRARGFDIVRSGREDTPDEFRSAHVINVPWCQCCEARVPADHVCACEVIAEPSKEWWKCEYSGPGGQCGRDNHYARATCWYCHHPRVNAQKAEVCGRCRGSGRVPSPGGVEGEYCACGRCGGSGHAKSEGDQR